MPNYKAGDKVLLDVKIPTQYYSDSKYIIYFQEIVLEDNEDEEEEFLVLKAKVKLNYTDSLVIIKFSRHGRCGTSSDFYDNPYLFNQTV